MNTKNSLTIGMGIFFIIVFLTFGTIVVNEKSKTIFLPKIDKKLDTYIKVKYKKQGPSLQTLAMSLLLLILSLTNV